MDTPSVSIFMRVDSYVTSHPRARFVWHPALPVFILSCLQDSEGRRSHIVWSSLVTCTFFSFFLFSSFLLFVYNLWMLLVCLFICQQNGYFWWDFFILHTFYIVWCNIFKFYFFGVDNPSYFTIAGQASPVVTPSSTVTDSGVKPKRFKNWFKLKTKKNLDSQISSSTHYKPPCPSPEPAEAVEQQPPVLYYNFCQAPINDDDVFVSSETWTAAGGSSRTLNNHRRRHSLGSWFRFSLAAAVRSNNKNITESNENRPSTSSERTLLPRNVSSSANSVR